MSFRIFAAGTDNFHYERKGCEDGSNFDKMKIITALQSMDFSSTGKAAITGTGEYIGYNTPCITDLMSSLATMESLHNISNAVSFLAMNSNASDGWIYVNATETHALWTDTVRAAKYSFSPGNSPGSEFISTIVNCLKDTSMDNFGVLMMLSLVLSKFSQHIDDSTVPKISISLTK